MPSRIVRLYVDNYRCMVNFELRPERRSLFLGYNGSGKSSVFDVLYAIKTLIETGAPAKDAFPTNTVTRFGGSNEQRFELDVESGVGMLRYTLVLEHGLKGDIPAITLEELSLDGKPAYRLASGRVHLHLADATVQSEPFPFSPRYSYLSSYDPEEEQSPIAVFKAWLAQCWVLHLDPMRIGAMTDGEHPGLFRDGRNFAHYCRFMLQEKPEAMENAHTVLGEIVPGFQRLRMQSAGRSKLLVATFQYPVGGLYDVDFDLLSDGQKALIVLYVVLQTARSQTVLCLDEPDNFVSIREIQPFLTELADVSDETGLQVMLISHSPEVIDYAGASGALLFERPEGGYTRVRAIDAKGPLRLSERMARGWLPGGSDGAS